jgi:hypothetical protein
MTRILTLIAGWLFVIEATTLNCRAEEAPDSIEPTLTIHLFNQADVPQDIIVDAKEHVVRILGDAGIHVAWDGTDGLAASLR